MSCPTVLIADDHKLFVEGLRILLQPEFRVIGDVEDGWDLIEAAITRRPDIILADISMPRLNGIEAARRLRAAGCNAKLLILSMHAGVDYVSEARAAGADGYLLKHCEPDEVLKALREVVLGRKYIAERLKSPLLEATRGRFKSEAPTVKLTPREREVLQLLARGTTVKKAATILQVSPRTVQFHRYNISEKLGLKTVAELATYAVKNGFVVA